MTRPAQLIALFIALPLAAAPVPKAKLPEMEVLLMATSLLQGEQLNFDVQFTNRGSSEVTQYDARFGEVEWGTTVVEVQGPSDKQFRRPYDQFGGLLPLDKRTPGAILAVGRSLTHSFTLPCADVQKHPVFHEGGKWHVRARLLLYGGVEKVSETVTIQVAEQTVEKMEKLRLAEKRFVTAISDTAQKWEDEVPQLQKLADAIGPSHTADWRQTQVLEIRLCLIATGKSHETREDVLQDVETYLKKLPTNHQTHLCGRVVYQLFDRRKGAYRAEDIPLARKFAERMSEQFVTRVGLLNLLDEEEKRLKAKQPEKK